MANTISNMKVTNQIRELVSKRRKRYQNDGFNLDLAYIRPDLIAMGFPAEKLEGVYRNPIDEVYKFLENKHNDVYKIYNLCSERSYDTTRFHNRVGEYPFDDHNPPSIELIKAFCDDVHQWLKADKNNIAAVHCKAGKGRTGTMICCFMLHDGNFETAADALHFYDEKRTHDKKGVTIPSQRRYVEYYARLLKSGKPYVPVLLQICEFILTPPPIFNSYQGSVFFNICNSKGVVFHSASIPDFKKSHGNNSDGFIIIKLDQCIPLAGDIKVEFYSKNVMKRKEKLFHFWFNTYFANELAEETIPSNGEPKNLIYRLKKLEIDTAHKDKQDKIYPSDFEVQIILQRIPSGSSYTRSTTTDNHIGQDEKLNFVNNTTAVTRTPSESSEATSSSESSTEEDGLWESGECSTSSSTTTKKTTTKILKKLIDYDQQQLQQKGKQSIKNKQQQQQQQKSLKLNKILKNNTPIQLQQQTQFKVNKNNYIKLNNLNERAKWFTNKYTNPYFIDNNSSDDYGHHHHPNHFNSSPPQHQQQQHQQQQKTINVRSRHTSINLDTDYYSLLCDKQLSLGSPIKNDYLRQINKTNHVLLMSDDDIVVVNNKNKIIIDSNNSSNGSNSSRFRTKSNTIIINNDNDSKKNIVAVDGNNDNVDDDDDDDDEDDYILVNEDDPVVPLKINWNVLKKSIDLLDLNNQIKKNNDDDENENDTDTDVDVDAIVNENLIKNDKLHNDEIDESELQFNYVEHHQQQQQSPQIQQNTTITSTLELNDEKNNSLLYHHIDDKTLNLNRTKIQSIIKTLKNDDDDVDDDHNNDDNINVNIDNIVDDCNIIHDDNNIELENNNINNKKMH